VQLRVKTLFFSAPRLNECGHNISCLAGTTEVVAKAADENGGKKKSVAMMWRKWREVTRRLPFTESEGTIADHRILSSHVTITITMSHCHLNY
jgi:hypothetical protein